MPLLILAVIMYAVYAEWRIVKLKNQQITYMRALAKIQDDKTLWYSGVLPKAGELCLFQETGGDYVISKLSDKRWLGKDGSVDFAKIKRWLYLKDLDKL